jgi:hypothetical protein
MTVKEIAETVGKTERSVQLWIEKILTGKMPASSGKISLRNSIAEKAAHSSPERPADYTPEEALLIIEAGIGKNAAGVWRANLGMAAELAQIKEKLLDYSGFRADIQKFLENNSQKALPNPKEVAYHHSLCRQGCKSFFLKGCRCS